MPPERFVQTLVPARGVPYENNVTGHASATLRAMQNHIEVRWADLKIPDADFDVAALHSALDSRRAERGMSWKAVAHEVNRADNRYGVHPISASTISGLKNKRW